MTASTPKPEIPPLKNKVTRVQELYLRVTPYVSAKRVWDWLFTEEERQRLGNDIVKWYVHPSTVISTWIKLRGGSQVRAVLDIAHELNLLTHAEYRSLLRENEEQAAPTPHPSWDKDAGELRFRGGIIRKVKGSVAKRVVEILDCFQIDGWQTSIWNPFPPDYSVTDAVHSLNAGLTKIKFHVGANQQSIYWSES